VFREPPRKKKCELRIFSPDEANRFVSACEDQRLGPYVALLALGARLGEALGLGWADVNLANGRRSSEAVRMPERPWYGRFFERSWRAVDFGKRLEGLGC
jgi:integrase